MLFFGRLSFTKLQLSKWGSGLVVYSLLKQIAYRLVFKSNIKKTQIRKVQSSRINKTKTTQIINASTPLSPGNTSSHDHSSFIIHSSSSSSSSSFIHSHSSFILHSTTWSHHQAPNNTTTNNSEGGGRGSRHVKLKESKSPVTPAAVCVLSWLLMEYG